MNLSEMIAVLERATEAQQDEVIRRALRFAVAHGWITAAACERAMRMCDAEAYESAALALLPQNDWISWKIEGGTNPRDPGAIACVAIWSERDHGDLPNNGIRYGTKWRTGATPAIALGIAAMKARFTEGAPS